MSHIFECEYETECQLGILHDKNNLIPLYHLFLILPII